MKRIPPVFFILLLLLIVFVGWHYPLISRVNSAVGEYFMQAVRIITDGVTPFYPDNVIPERIVYPLWLSAFFSFFGGPNLSVAQWATVLIYVVIIIVAYYFTKMLFGFLAACLSTLLLCLAFELYEIGITSGIDVLSACFILFSCFLFIKACMKNKPLLFVGSGIAFSFACFTKANAIVYIIFPLLIMLFVKKFRSKEIVIGGLLFYSSAIVLFLVFGIILVNNGYSFLTVFGIKPSQNQVLTVFGITSILGVSKAFISGFWTSFNDFANRLIVFFPPVFPGFGKYVFYLMLVGHLSILWLGLYKKSNPDKIFLAVILPILPVVAVNGVWQGESRQVILFIVFSYIALGRFLSTIFYSKHVKKFVASVSMKISKMIQIRRKIMLAVGLVFGVIVLAVLVTGLNNQRIRKFASGFNCYFDNLLEVVSLKHKVQPRGRFGEKGSDVAEWINKNIPHGSEVCLSGISSDAIMFYTKLKYKHSYQNMAKYRNIFDLVNSSDWQKALENGDRVVGIMTTKKFRSSTLYKYRKLCFVVLKSDFIDFVNNLNSERMWICVDEGGKVKFPFVDEFISDFSQKVYDKNGISIYESNPKNNDGKTRIIPSLDKVNWTPGTKEDLLWLKENYPSEYKNIGEFLGSQGIEIN